MARGVERTVAREQQVDGGEVCRCEVMAWARREQRLLCCAWGGNCGRLHSYVYVWPGAARSCSRPGALQSSHAVRSRVGHTQQQHGGHQVPEILGLGILVLGPRALPSQESRHMVGSRQNTVCLSQRASASAVQAPKKEIAPDAASTLSTALRSRQSPAPERLKRRAKLLLHLHAPNTPLPGCSSPPLPLLSLAPRHCHHQRRQAPCRPTCHAPLAAPPPAARA